MWIWRLCNKLNCSWRAGHGKRKCQNIQRRRRMRRLLSGMGLKKLLFLGIFMDGTDPGVCTKSGVKVLVTDFTKSTETDFVLSAGSFSKLAVGSKAAQFLKMGTVDIDYKRIPCDYRSQNMNVKVDKSSKYPDYLAVQFLYQGGQTDITAVDIDRVGSSGWQYMTRKNGAIWGIQNPPIGSLSFRLLVTGGYDGSWVWPTRNLLPAIWRPGSVYESGVQITEIAQEGCSPCETGNWTDTHTR